jgi:NAD(P)-dependent dehydrogenase (short-subunit alcohol dehydrogenase family)
MGLLTDRVILITGGARGQGRAHAVASAREGAGVVPVDLAEPTCLDSAAYPLASPDDLSETVRLV